MAHFISSIRGNKGEASRLGSKDSGIKASACGWNCGMEISGRHNRNEEDVFNVFADHGSNGGGNYTWLAQASNGPDGYQMKVNPDLPKEIPEKDYKELVSKITKMIMKLGPLDSIGAVVEDILLELNYICDKEE